MTDTWRHAARAVATELQAIFGGRLRSVAAYGAHLGYLHKTTPWPPGRNDPCWCGSGTKYKKCCGGLRFPAEKDG